MQWNSSTTYGFEIERDFGTDYGICCWYTPQLNFTEIMKHTEENHLEEPDWGHWFTGIAKVRQCCCSLTEKLLRPSIA